ncbi:MAG: hypothetical protein ACYC0P_03180 [Thiobacillus sp.]
MIDFTPAKTQFRICVLMVMAVQFSGCGEFAYKRGANSNDLEAAKHSCREKGPDSAAFAKCMADSGWAVQNLGKMEPLDADPVVEASIMPSDRRIESSAGAPPVEPGAEGYVPASPGAAKPATLKRTPEMTDTFKVSSWWKAGSGADRLKSDTEECVARLGETHRPAQTQQAQTATRGLLLCMKEKGWSALRAK